MAETREALIPLSARQQSAAHRRILCAGPYYVTP